MDGTVATTPGGRVDRSWLTFGLAVGDCLLVVAHLSYGLLSHDIDPLRVPWYAALTVAPFLVGWALVAPAVGAYSIRARSSVWDAAVVTVAAWVGAALVGAAIRATPWLPGGAPPIFVAVTVGVGLATLVPWRVLVAFVRSS